jgi:transcriptional regulator with XRE-family HTH domain
MKLVALKQVLSVNIKARRAELGISQEKLALKADIDRTYMSEIERQLANPTLEVILKVSNALELPPEDLLKKLK